MLLADSTDYASVSTSWDLPAGDWSQLRLVRNAAGTPRDERDGDILFTDDFAVARTNYSDTELTTGRYYYYGLWVLLDGTWVPVGDAAFLVSKDWGYTGKLYASLPEVFKGSSYTNVVDSDEEPENSFLYRFLAVFGFQLDALRSETESLRFILDPTLVNQAMLPALSTQVGVPYEPEIGTRALRGLIANAIHLWGLKGTVPGVRELASVLTGYVTHIRIGRNLALDNLDAGPTTDKGRWTGRTNSIVTYRANTALDDNPAGGGVRVMTALFAGVAAMDMNLDNSDGLVRRQYAIPVLEGLDYVVSQYARRVGAATNAQMLIQWLDADGEALGAPVGTALAAVDVDWTRLSSAATAPADARYLEASLLTDAMVAGDSIETCGFMVQEDTALDDWQCARETQVYLDPQIINYIGNTSGSDGTSVGWSAGVEPVSDPTFGFYLVKFVPDPPDPNDVYPIDALEVVVPGDAVPPDPPPEDSLAPTENWYPDAHMAVTPGETWTAFAEAIPPIGDDGTVDRYGRIGFRLYNTAGDLVGHSMGTEELLHIDTWTPLTHQLVIPDDAAYDHIEFCIITEGLCGFRHTALEKVNQYGAFYFDGSSESTTGDFLWSGTPFRSPSVFYDRRSSRTVRLRALLNDYLPHGSCYDIYYATEAIPDTPQSIAGVNPDPATSLPL